MRGDSKISCHDAGCTIVELEKGTSASNKIERAIKTLKMAPKMICLTNSPLTLWCYCVERRARTINSIVRTNHLLQGSTPYSKLSGQPTDISMLCEFGWYE